MVYSQSYPDAAGRGVSEQTGFWESSFQLFSVGPKRVEFLPSIVSGRGVEVLLGKLYLVNVTKFTTKSERLTGGQN